MANAPDFSAYGAADYTMAVAGGMLDVNVNESYNSGYYWDPDDRLRQPAFALLGGYVKWTDGEGKWSYRLWGNNVTSRHYYTYEDALRLRGCLLTRHARYLRRRGRTKILTGTGER